MHGSDRDRVVLSLAVFAVLLSQVQLYPGVPDLVAALGATTDLDASTWFLAAEFAAYVAFAGVWGAASDALGKRTPLIVVAGGLAAACYLALAALPALFAPDFGVVLAVRILQGGATVGVLSLSMTMLMDLDGGHGRNMGAAGIAIGSGVALGAPLGGILTSIDPLAPLYVAAVLIGVSATLVALVEDRAPAATGRLRAALSSIADTPTLSVPYAFGFVDRLTAGFFSLAGTFYFRDVFGLDAVGTGMTLALFFGPFALLQYPFGTLSDRVGRVPPIAVGSICYGFAIVAVGLAGELTTVRALMVLVGILGALVAPATMALVTDLADRDARGAAMAGFNVAGSLGFLTGIVLGGTLVGAYDYVTAFAVVGALEILIVLIALRALVRLETPSARVAGVD